MPTAAGQGELFGDDYAQPDAADGEPVCWIDGAGQSKPDGDFVQADLSACSAQADASDQFEVSLGGERPEACFFAP